MALGEILRRSATRRTRSRGTATSYTGKFNKSEPARGGGTSGLLVRGCTALRPLVANQPCSLS